MERTPKLHQAKNLLSSNSGAMRPYIGKDGEFYVNQFMGGDKNQIENYKPIKVNAAALRYDEWRMLDDAVVQVAEQRLVGFDDLRRNGLVYNLNNAMATTVLTWEEMSDAMEASVSMDPVRRGNNDTVVHQSAHLPIPIVHADYQISERVLQESRTRGNGLDISNAQRATRRVAEQLEDMLFGSTSVLTYGGGTIYTYLTHPDINLVPFGTTTDYWDDASKTGADIIADVLAMKQALIADKHYGPYMIYIPTDYETVIDADYSVSGASGQTIRQRILAIEKIQGVSVVDRLADDTVLMVQMTSDVVDLVDGMPIQNVEWSTEGGFIHNYKVMTIQVPRIRSDYNNTSGIAKMS
jgi:uncharacterized linocin/CFP29 family protein